MADQPLETPWQAIGPMVGALWCAQCKAYFPMHPKYRHHQHCGDCGRVKGCTADCEDMNCVHCATATGKGGTAEKNFPNVKIFLDT